MSVKDAYLGARDFIASMILVALVGMFVIRFLSPSAKAPLSKCSQATEAAPIGRPGADGSGATGRVGDSLEWEIYAQRPELGGPPAVAWLHGPGWSVRCEMRPPGSLPPSRCVTMQEPVRIERSRR